MRLFALLLLLAAPAFADADRYNFVPDPEAISFTYEFDNREFRGSFPTYSGNLLLDLDNVPNSSVDVTIETGDGTAGFIFATQTLRGPTMLWSKEYPAMRFVSTSARQVGTEAVLDGNLTIRDVTKPVTLRVQLFRDAGSDPNERDDLTFLATTQFKRSDFGATGYPKLVSDTLNVEIKAQIKRQP
ncbi:MAG: YceI family protein [Pseudomonadota bacterium]